MATLRAIKRFIIRFPLWKSTNRDRHLMTFSLAREGEILVLVREVYATPELGKLRSEPVDSMSATRMSDYRTIEKGETRRGRNREKEVLEGRNLS